MNERKAGTIHEEKSCDFRPARLRPARRGLVRSARVWAAVVLLALSGALALPATAQAQADPPTLSSAEVGTGGTTIELIFSEDLHQVPLIVPTAIVSAFTLKVDGVERQISNIVANVPNRFGISVSSAIYQGQTVVVSYDQSVAGTNAIADSDGDEVASFTTGVAGVPAMVNNSSVMAPLPAPTGFSAEAGDGEVTLSWNPPGSASGVTHHDYRFRTNGSYRNWIEIDDSGPGETNASGFTVTRDIVNDRAYTFQLRAGGDDGDSLAAEAGRVTPMGPVTGLAPTVTSVVVASAPQSGDTYGLYETILFTVTFSEPVELKPQGRLRLKVGLDDPGGASGSTVEAVFSRITRSQYPTADTPQTRRARHMHFEYKVQLFDRDEDGVRIGANALRLGSGARIRSEGGRDVELDHAAVGPLSDHKVDGTADVPMIERIKVVSTPRLWSRGARGGHLRRGRDHPHRGAVRPAGARRGRADVRARGGRPLPGGVRGPLRVGRRHGHAGVRVPGAGWRHRPQRHRDPRQPDRGGVRRQHPQRRGPGGAPFLQEGGHAERPQDGRVAGGAVVLLGGGRRGARGRRRDGCSRCAWSRAAWAS